VPIADTDCIKKAVCLAKYNLDKIGDIDFSSVLKILETALKKNKKELAESYTLETGFVIRDTLEMIEISIDFLNHFKEYCNKIKLEEKNYNFYNPTWNKMHLFKLGYRPWGTVAVLTPFNASFPLNIITLISALYGKNAIILKPSSQTAYTSLKFGEFLLENDLPRGSISVLNSGINDFFKIVYKHPPNLIHYIGNSSHIPKLMQDTFINGINLIADGGGNGLVIIDEFSAEKSAKIIAEAIRRNNGEECTTPRGIFVREEIYEGFLGNLANELSKYKTGDPLDSRTDIGPVLNMKVINNLKMKIKLSKAKIVSGGFEKDNFMKATILLLNSKFQENILAKEELFGPIVWIKKYKSFKEVIDFYDKFRYGLTATVLSNDKNNIEYLSKRIPPFRIVLNSDPTIQSPFSPWGAYYLSGRNYVSHWIEKYQQKYLLERH